MFNHNSQAIIFMCRKKAKRSHLLYLCLLSMKFIFAYLLILTKNKNGISFYIFIFILYFSLQNMSSNMLNVEYYFAILCNETYNRWMLKYLFFIFCIISIGIVFMLHQKIRNVNIIDLNSSLILILLLITI